MAKRKSISAVVPAYNVEQSLQAGIESLAAVLRECADKFEIIIIDDGSTDRTGELADRLAEADPEHVRAIRHQQQLGYGASLREGFQAAGMSLILQFTADGQFDPADLGKLLELGNRHDIVTGYRLGRQDSWQRRLLSWGFRKFAGVVFGVHATDCNCGMKLYRRKVFKHIVIKSRGFLADAEILAKANVLGYRVTEVGVGHRRAVGDSRRCRFSHMAGTLGEAWHMLHAFELTPDETTAGRQTVETQ